MRGSHRYWLHGGVRVSYPQQPSDLDRLLTAIRLILRAEVPAFTFFGTYEYSIQSVSGQTVTAAPTDTTLPLPSIQNLPIQPSVFAEGVTGIQSGQTCLVQFVNADPTRPEVVSLSQLSTTSTLDATGSVTIGSVSTTSVALGGGTAPIARMGDLVTLILPLPAPPPTISGTINGAIPFTGTIVGLPPGVAGIITGANPKVQS